MDKSSHEGDIPMPITGSYGGGEVHGHGHGPGPGNMVLEEAAHNHIVPTTASPISSNGPIGASPLEDHVPYKKVVKYKECLKNHAAAMGGNATDGCGEFMPSGEEGTREALRCSACSCHRNFHRKDIEGDQPSPLDHYYPIKGRKVVGQKGVLIAGSDPFAYPTNTLISRPQPPQMFMSTYNLGLPYESDEQEGGGGVGPLTTPAALLKKRFRTKFTPEQKEKMLSFAEKVGWRIQKQEEGVVQQFCQEIGIKRRVLKVWMHNNKHNLAKKGCTAST